MQDTSYQHKKYLSVAYSIGRQLARNAIWAEDGRCNWQGANSISRNGYSQIANVTFKADIYNGLSGIALFLAELWLQIPDSIIKALLDGTVLNILQQHKENPIHNNFGVYNGQLGVGFTLWEIGQKLNNPIWRSKGLEIISSLKQQPLQPYEIDVIGGAAGAIPILLRIHKIEQDALFLEMANKCGQFLINCAVKTKTSWYWNTIGSKIGMTGYSHGVAGIVSALLDLYHHTQKQIYLEAALFGVQFEREQFIPEQNNWPDLRNPKKDKLPKCLTLWCHGAPGIALSRIKAYQLTKKIDFLQEAETALKTTYLAIQKNLENPQNSNFSLCHGLSGNAEVLLIGGEVFNIPDYIEIAQKVGNIGIELYEEPRTDWLSGVGGASWETKSFYTTPGLMLGNAGIGYFYLRLATSIKVPSLLLL